MRTLILLRGCPGSGKSTWVRNHNLQNYTLEPDAIRLMAQAPVTTVEGTPSISQSNDSFVWSTLFDILEQRMKRGDLTVVDATHSRSKLINRYRQLAKTYRYRVYVVDFSSIPLSTILSQNANRPTVDFVPEEHIQATYYRMQDMAPPGWVTTVPYDDSEAISAILTYKPYDASHYSEVRVIGDIQGCYDSLIESIGEWSSDTLYVFVGDYLDRGIQNKQVLDYIYSIHKEPNVVLLEGNHERHWRNWLADPNCKLPKFTRKAFDELGESTQYIKSIYSKLSQAFYFKFQGCKYVVTHGGVPCLPTPYMSTDEFVFGVGKYVDAHTVDVAFTENVKSCTFSIHGHRNTANEPIENTKGTFNLCGTPEFGGMLRSLRIDSAGITPVEIKQDIFELTKPALQTPVTINKDANEILTEFMNNKYVKVKELADDILSVNFTRKAFSSRKWNDVTCKARGLFLDKSGNVLARSYDKFHNYQEQLYTNDSAIRDYTYPIQAYRKENGFLGILSVVNGEWFIASKSTNEGPFADMFRELVEPYLTDYLKEYVTSNNLSLIFEVNHLDDPHLVEYSESHLVLLEAIHNQHNFNKLTYSDLEVLADNAGFAVKQRVATLHNYQEWRQFRELHKSDPISDVSCEGWVLEDAEQRMFKLKANGYSFWKRMRSLKESTYKCPVDNYNSLSQRLHKAEEFQVFNFFKSLSKDDLSKDIITLRNQYYKGAT